MTVKVKISTVLRKYTKGEKTLDMSPGSISSILDEMMEKYPKIKNAILDENQKIKNYINIFLNEKMINTPEGLNTMVGCNDRLMILMAISGG